MKKLVLVLLMALMVCGMAAARDYTYVDLVNQLTDFEGLAVLPAQGETCTQWSSYDRASRYDAQTEKYVGWDANGDGGGVIRPEGSGFVVAEMEGPGCIRRIWSAAPKEGHVRIYLDGNPEPVVDLPFIGYFDCKNAPFTYPSLVHTVALGWNNYVPIPYQKSCKIVMDKDWGAYYHFVYTTFPKGTTIPTLTRDLSAEELAALNKADRYLRKGLETDPAGHRQGESTEFKQVELSAGQESVVVVLDGPQAITGLWIKLDPGVDVSVLRNVDLKISWDGEKNPSVWSPIGDFFGTGPGLNKYKSLPLGMTDGGFYSYWYMPFGKKAVVELANEGDKPFAGQIMVTHAPLTKPIEQLARFHAKWHRDAFLPTEKERWIDWPMLKAEGKGRFCGVSLEVWNPKGGWWGEGDEKFFVDGELFPSTIGTGSEDYFGYAWCNPTLFQNAYHNQTRVTNNVGHVAVNRWHIVDNIPFQKSFEGDIEKYYLNDRPTLYASTVYWYLSPDGSDPYKAVPVKDRSYFINPPRAGIPGALEGESLKAEVTGGNTSIQDLAGKWSGDAHLWWTQGKPGDALKVTVPVKKAGNYDFMVALTKARDYGIVELSLDGIKLGGPIDLYDPNVVPTGEISLGIRSLNAGDHILSVEITGANEQAIKAYMFGLDYVKLAKAK